MDLQTLLSSPPRHFAIDSRLVEKGSLFFALEGAKVDGHSFLKEVKEKGALAAVIRQNYSGDTFGLPVLPVRSPLELLQNLAKTKVEKEKPMIVGITGSVGKTTTKDWVATLLNEAFPAAYNRGSENTKCTLPLTLLNRWQGEKHLVLEMGMTHKGDLSRLVAIAPPKMALLTSIALSHAINFATLKGIAEGKGEIFSQGNVELAFIPFEVEEKKTLLSLIKSPVQTFSSTNPQADLYLKEVGDQIVVKYRGEKLSFSYPGFAPHLLSNLAGAILVAKNFNLSWEQIASGLMKLTPSPNRMVWLEKGALRILNDSYNANEVSTKGALEVLSKQKGRKIFVFGAIGELGPFCVPCHTAIANFASERADLFFALDRDAEVMHQIWEKEGKESYFTCSKEELKETLNKKLRSGDVLLIKGSNRHKLWTLIEEIACS